MFKFKKFVEGIAVIDDDTGASRLISPEEETALSLAYPSIKNPKTASLFMDELPAGIAGPGETL